MNPNCDMPECIGSTEDKSKAVRDPDGTLLEMCESCLADGWQQVVTVVE